MNTTFTLPQPELARLTPQLSRADLLVSVSPFTEERIGRFIGAAGISYLSLSDPDLGALGPNPGLEEIASFEGVIIQSSYTPPAAEYVSRFAANLSLKAAEMNVPRALVLGASVYESDPVRSRYSDRLKAREEPDVTDILVPMSDRFNPAVFRWWLGSIASRYEALL